MLTLVAVGLLAVCALIGTDLGHSSLLYLRNAVRRAIRGRRYTSPESEAVWREHLALGYTDPRVLQESREHPWARARRQGVPRG